MNELIEQIVSEWVLEKRVNLKSRRAAKITLRRDWEDLAVLLDNLSLLTQRAADGGKPTELREDDNSCQCLMCGDVHRRR